MSEVLPHVASGNSQYGITWCVNLTSNGRQATLTITGDHADYTAKPRGLSVHLPEDILEGITVAMATARALIQDSILLPRLRQNFYKPGRVVQGQHGSYIYCHEHPDNLGDPTAYIGWIIQNPTDIEGPVETAGI